MKKVMTFGAGALVLGAAIVGVNLHQVNTANASNPMKVTSEGTQLLTSNNCVQNANSKDDINQCISDNPSLRLTITLGENGGIAKVED